MANYTGNYGTGTYDTNYGEGEYPAPMQKSKVKIGWTELVLHSKTVAIKSKGKAIQKVISNRGNEIVLKYK